MKRVLPIVVLAACGTSGEPIKGDIAIQYGDKHETMKVGSVVQDRNIPGNMLVQIGSDEVDCDTYLDVFFSLDYPEGTFVYFSVDKAGAPATYPMATVSVTKSTSSSNDSNISDGMVQIDTIGDRVTGNVTFTTTDSEVGEISVSGTFDVKSCL